MDKARFAQAVITAFQNGVHTKVEGREYMYDVESRVERKGLMDMSSKSPLSKYLRLSPTRITNTTQSLWDVALTSPNSPVRHCGVLDTTIGNHFPRLPVYVELKLKSPKPSPYYISRTIRRVYLKPILPVIGYTAYCPFSKLMK